MHNESATPPVEAPPIQDRPESVGFWAKAWPILALGFMTLLFVRACIPASAPPPPERFDAAAAAKAANAKALAALAKIDASTPVNTTLEALNSAVIEFAPGSSEILPTSQPVLARMAFVMKALPPNLRLEVIAHTDDTASADANLLLSRKRAQAVADVLIANGVPRERVHAHGLGDTRPVASNATEEGRFRNRRIEIRALAR